MRLGILFLAIIAFAAPGFAAPGERPPRCDARVAEVVSIETVQADFGNWEGRCVSLRGIRVGDRLYADRFDILEPLHAPGEEPRRSIVVYPESRIYRGEPARVEVIGRLGSCAAMHQAVDAMSARSPDQIMWVSGYCHTSLANFVRPGRIRILSRQPIVRLTETEVPLERRPLVEAPTSLPRFVLHVEAARALVAAVATGDEDAFFRLAEPNAEFIRNRSGGGPPPDWIGRRQRQSREALRELREAGSPITRLLPLERRQERTFVERGEEEDISDNGAWPVSFITCWCRTADCTGRWPVISLDADNHPTRAYACVRTSDFIIAESPARAIQATVPEPEGGLAEPRWRQRLTGSD